MRRSPGNVLVVLGVVAAVVLTSTLDAAGQPGQEAGGAGGNLPTQQALNQARAHFKNAEAAKARGEYETAALEYLAAYALFQEPEFFFNVGEVYRLAGDEQNALSYYEKYVYLAPAGRGAAMARAHIDQLRQAIAARHDAIARAKAEEEKRKADDDRRRTALEERERTVAQARSRGRNLRIAGFVSGGAGVAALGAGVVFGLRARSIDDELSRADAFSQTRYDQGQAAERNAILLASAGVAAMVTAGVLYYFGQRATQSDEAGNETRVTFVPLVEPSQVAVAVIAEF